MSMGERGLLEIRAASLSVLYDLRVDLTEMLLQRDDSSKCVGQGAQCRANRNDGELNDEPTGMTGNSSTTTVMKDHSGVIGQRGLTWGASSTFPTSRGSVFSHIGPDQR